ncbi:hypothetical protein ACH5RR_021545 [Cinchona calisaya]|uniref:Uncharacterized protein n=1 Tax=Cinchona calisaya TaxID=153742 RepID=A0ABD2ZHM2_9GENT
MRSETIHPETFFMTGKMTRGQIYDLTTPILAHLYRQLGHISNAKKLGQLQVTTSLLNPMSLAVLAVNFDTDNIALNMLTLDVEMAYLLLRCFGIDEECIVIVPKHVLSLALLMVQA